MLETTFSKFAVALSCVIDQTKDLKFKKRVGGPKLLFRGEGA